MAHDEQTAPSTGGAPTTGAVRSDARGLDLQLTRLPGVGAKIGKALDGLGLRTVDDLLHHLPRRYLQRGTPTALGEVQEGDRVVISARVLSADLRQMRQRRGVLLQCRVTDGERTLDLTFFGRHPGALSYHQRTLTPGSVHFFSGVVGSYRGALQLTHPEFEPVEESAADGEADFLRPVPVYPASAGLTTWTLGRLIRSVLASTDPADLDVLPEAYRRGHQLPSGAKALELVHRPADEEEHQRGRRALAHEEALVLQTAMAQRRYHAREEVTRPRPPQPGGLREAFETRLPFELTPGQRQVGDLISEDLASPVPMLRLLQGDVGAGKTLVALRAMLQVIDAGGQAVLLAPTEVLVHQHQRSIQDLLGPLASPGPDLDGPPATRVVALTGSMGVRKRREVLARIASGEAGIVVGTHALLTGEVMFDDLALVVIDEQHRFGVRQREVLRSVGETTPHLLHMTATPIPRTVAMTVFGDLDLTDLPGLPGGRSPVSTVLVDEHNERWMARVWQRAAEEVAAGGRVFVVAPRIEAQEEAGETLLDLVGAPAEGSDGPSAADAPTGRGSSADPSQAGPGGEFLLDLDEAGGEERVLHTVADTAGRLRTVPALDGLGIATLHGRMSAEEKDAAMASFVRGDTPILVSTTVIEVGVDVPEASLMVILDADRFGLAQLHQLRGRVGRGTRPSVCLAVAPGTIAPASQERLSVFASTTDGFRLAEQDVTLRSEGNVLGAQQSGRRSSLRVLNVTRDAAILTEAREAARALVQDDPTLANHPALREAVRRRVEEDEDASTYLDAS